MNCECGPELLCMPHRILSDLGAIAAELDLRGEPRLAAITESVYIDLENTLKGKQNAKRPNLSEQVSESR